MKKQDIAKAQRNKEKREFLYKFRIRIIQEYFLDRVFEQFSYSCYNCGYSGENVEGVYDWRYKGWKLCNFDRWNIVLDHHIPMIAGGHYELGNLVVLCRDCNGKKLDRDPRIFYEQSKLHELQIILERQKSLIDFKFDEEYFWRDAFGYLCSLGISSELIKNTIYNEYHPYYFGINDMKEQVSWQLNNSQERTGKLPQ
jgi:5-methylcytosine-specific restriction endonuclease McrA